MINRFRTAIQRYLSGNPNFAIQHPILLKIFALVAVLILCDAKTEAQGKPARIGYLDERSAVGSGDLLDAFRKQMIQLGWVEENNLAIEYRYAEGKIDRLAQLVAELVNLKLDVILVTATGPALAAKKATRAIPIVMVSVGDPVQRGLIASLAQPGANITGLATFAEELAGKRVEIFKEVLPRSTRMGVITGGSGIGGELQVKAMQEVASAIGLKLEVVGTASDAEKLVKAFQTAVRERVNAITTITGSVIFAQRKSIVVLAANYKLPAIYPVKEFVEDGGLISYGVDRRDLYRRAAIYVDKILSGAKPAEIPVERPTKFELFANLKTAKQIGLTIPSNLLARADRVIK